MKRSRIPGLNPPGEHVLISARPGKNRFLPGRYVCSCGNEYTGTNAYEAHRAAERKAS